MRALAVVLALLAILGSSLCPAEPIASHAAASVAAAEPGRHVHGDLDEFLPAGGATRAQDVADVGLSAGGADIWPLPRSGSVAVAPPIRRLGPSLILNPPLRR